MYSSTVPQYPQLLVDYCACGEENTPLCVVVAHNSTSQLSFYWFSKVCGHNGCHCGKPQYKWYESNSLNPFVYKHEK
jgi:hypothetical protein